MNRRRVQYSILCEDKQTEVFARRFLKAKGIGSREMKFFTSPAAKEAADYWVINNFTHELNAYRASTTASALITIVDGDTIGLQQRMHQLENECKIKGILFKNKTDSVLIAVPTRNIETWIHYLNGNEVDEETQYPKLHKQSDCKSAVNRLVEICDNKESINGCPSLATTCEGSNAIFMKDDKNLNKWNKY